MRYVYNRQGIYTGQSLNLTSFDPFPVLSTEIEPPALSSGEYARFLGGSWEVITELPETPVRIPSRVTMRQFQLALIEMGQYDTVEAFIDALTGVDKKKALVEWRGAFAERASPSIAVYGASLGMTEEDIDNLFILADTL